MASVYRYYENPPIHQIGDTKMSAITFDHAGWLICDGRLLDKAYYKFLHNIIGDAFGVSGETHFRIPNGSGRVAAAIGSAGVGMNNWEMGDISGEERHLLTIDEMPAHTHDVSGAGLITIDGTGTTVGGSVLDNQGSGEPNLVRSPVEMSSKGNNLPHNTIQPTIYVGNMFIYGGF
jgi:microcystin-dependent protein